MQGVLAVILTLLDTVLGYTNFQQTGFVRQFEPVYYDHNELHKTYHMTKRSADTVIPFSFDAYGRTFSTILRRDENVLHPNLVVEAGQHTSQYDVTRAVKGYKNGEKSVIQGIITSTGHFEGKIITNNETYYIEKANQTLLDHRDIHSVIHKLSDITFNSSLTSCYHERLRNKQLKMAQLVRNRKHSTKNYDDVQSDWSLRYKSEAYTDTDIKVGWGEQKLRRQKRAIDPTKITCELFMQADHLYYEKYGSDVDTVIEKLAQHVQEVNTIYQAVDFDSTGGSDNINFVIKKIRIYTNPDAAGYKYKNPMDVEYFLDKHSEENYDDFCLSYLFTYRDFSNGVLGLAWIGGIDGVAGGVCENYNTFDGVGKSLNSGIVTVLNYGSDVPPAVSYVTFAHEIGHNFGSQHDDDVNAECAPGGTAGNYIMYAHATSGNLPNNRKLSSCSISAINTILTVKARSADGCFLPYTASVCGNRVVEGTEECDCGWEDECTEGCCNPQVYNVTGAPAPCMKKASSQCSPSEGPCCDSSCQFEVNTTQCRSASDCLSEAFCSGTSAECPASSNANNTTPCGGADDFLVCVDGECTGSVCMAYGRESCQCTGSEQLCHVCCKDGETCRSSYELDDIPDAKAVAGSPCNNFVGYCDVFKVCRTVDATGPLSRLRKMLLSGEAIETLKVWLTKHWYVGLAGGVGLVIIIVLVVVFCGKSQLKKITPTRTRQPMALAETSQSNQKQLYADRWM